MKIIVKVFYSNPAGNKPSRNSPGAEKSGSSISSSDSVPES